MNKNVKIMLVSSKSLTINTFFKPFIETCINNNIKISVMTSDIENLNIPKLEKIKIFLPNKTIELFNLYKILFFLFKNLKILKKNRDYVYLLNTPLASHSIRLVSFFLNIKIIYFVHGFRFHPKGNLFLNLLFKILELIFSLKTNLFIVINKHDFNFVKKINKKAIIVNGVGLSKEFIYNKNIKKIKNKNINIGIISAYRVNKGYDQVIELACLLKENSRFQFTCYGYDDFSKFKKKCDKLNLTNIVFKGFSNDIQKEILKFDLFLHLSRREGLSVSVIQCMKMGVPTIASNIRGINDIIKDKHNGFLVDPYLVENIKNIIFELSNDKDLYEKISNNSIRSINEKYFSKNINVKILNEIFKLYDNN